MKKICHENENYKKAGEANTCYKKQCTFKTKSTKIIKNYYKRIKRITIEEDETIFTYAPDYGTSPKSIKQVLTDVSEDN